MPGQTTGQSLELSGPSFIGQGITVIRWREDGQ